MAETLAIELAAPGGETLRVEWPAAAISDDGDGDGSTWRLAGEIDWDAVAALRVLTAGLGDGRTVALAALRPAGAAGHGQDAIGAVLVGGDEAEEIAEPLLSTEYGPDGLPRRVGLELFPSEDAVPLRVAADVDEVRRDREGETERVRARLAIRFGGANDTGSYEIVTAA